MTTSRVRWAVTAVRLALALVLGGKAAQLLLSAAHQGAGGTYAHVPFVTVAAIEVAGAAVMVAAPRRLVGHALLASSLVLGGILHVLHGEAPPAAFIVYLASIALVAVMRTEVPVQGEAHG